MTLDRQYQLIDRLFACQQSKLPELAERPALADSAFYASADHFARESQAIFRRVPLVLGPSSLVASAGDFRTLDVGGRSSLVTRGDDGRVHVFFNACRHRGALLVTEAEGCQKAFACPYHGWVYGNDGQLRHVTHPESFPNVDKATHGLIALPSDERFGLIWAVLDPQASIDVAAHVGDLAPELALLDLHRQVTYRPYTRTFTGNWKSFIENSLETYHVPYAHGEYVNRIATDMNLVDQFGPHLRLVQARGNFGELAGIPRHRWRTRPFTNTSYLLFPNTQLTVQPEHIICHQVFPTAVDKATISLTLYVDQAASGKDWDAVWERCREPEVMAMEEDMVVVETMAAGERTGWLPAHPIGRNEWPIALFHDTIRSHLAAGG